MQWKPWTRTRRGHCRRWDRRLRRSQTIRIQTRSGLWSTGTAAAQARTSGWGNYIYHIRSRSIQLGTRTVRWRGCRCQHQSTQRSAIAHGLCQTLPPMASHAGKALFQHNNITPVQFSREAKGPYSTSSLPLPNPADTRTGIAGRNCRGRCSHVDTAPRRRLKTIQLPQMQTTQLCQSSQACANIAGAASNGDTMCALRASAVHLTTVQGLPRRCGRVVKQSPRNHAWAHF